MESVQDPQAGASPSSFPEPDVQVVVTLKDGGTRTFDFARQGERYLARRLEARRQGEITAEAFNQLQVGIEEMITSEAD